MKLTPEAAPIGTVPRHFATTRPLMLPAAPITFGLYTPGSLYPGEYQEVTPDVVKGADQPELTDYSGTV